MGNCVLLCDVGENEGYQREKIYLESTTEFVRTFTLTFVIQRTGNEIKEDMKRFNVVYE